MKMNLSGRFAVRNLRANRLMNIPFTLAIATMLVLFNVMASLVSNSFVQTRHKMLPRFFQFGMVVIAIFTVVFAIYANRFLMKQRNRELALYAILGLERRHVRRILLLEQLMLFAVITVIGIVGGFVFGKVAFLLLNRLMRETAGSLMDFPFNMSAAILTAALSTGVFLLLSGLNGFSIRLATPSRLMLRQHRGEGEPKIHPIILLLGLLLLGAGYGIALKIEGTLEALLFFFLAVLLVIFGTYCLYVSLSVAVLKLQRSRKSYYRSPTKFLEVSGLLYRMKSNAVSLASITIMSTGIIIALSITLAINSRLEEETARLAPREYGLTARIDQTAGDDLQKRERLEAIRDKLKHDGAEVKKAFCTHVMRTSGILEGDTFRVSNGEQRPYFVFVFDLDGYNARTGQSISLADDELLITANKKELAQHKTLTFGEMTFKTRRIDNIIPSNYAIEVYAIVAKDAQVMRRIGDVLKDKPSKDKPMTPAEIHLSLYWDVAGLDNAGRKAYEADFKALEKQMSDVTFTSRQAAAALAYEMDGGFVFLGVLVGLVFAVGTVMVTFYKKVSEGFEDRESFQTMQRLGITDEQIRKTSASQMGWLFIGPLAVAALHSLVASKIVTQLLFLFGVKQYMHYLPWLGIVLGAFVILYFIIYRITSGTYYRLVR